MDYNSAQQVKKFISKNNLITPEGIVLFEASVTFYNKGMPVTIGTEIQIITLPKEMVMYMLEFVNDNYHQSEMYSTLSYNFDNTGKNIIEIRGNNYNGQPLFTIIAKRKK